MKRIIFLILFVSLACFSCKKKCIIDRPKHVNPIDWENYNDVHTVMWNYTGECSDFTLGKTGKTIKMYGWIFHPENVRPYDFYLLSDSLAVESNNPKCAMVRIQCFNNKEHAAMQAKFDTTNLTKRCYVAGELIIFDQSNNDCCTTTPNIFIEGAGNILFE